MTTSKYFKDTGRMTTRNMLASESGDEAEESFLCLKNIRTFLKVCHDKFGLRNSELFDPFDLFDVRDFGKPVMSCRGPCAFCADTCGADRICLELCRSLVRS
ncbi:hypothetical protein WMY93_021972 [Mugilogobius chulae]|uniref:Calponin-homology (CH) domain-containing protein n=1 Tax=Mugilogobius chulae TaxID=88201 RepID=A0AAW0NC75_9GOBI